METGRAEIDNGFESSEDVQAKQAINGAFRWEFMAGHGDVAKRAFEDLEMRDDHERDVFFAACGQRFTEGGRLGGVDANGERCFWMSNHSRRNYLRILSTGQLFITTGLYHAQNPRVRIRARYQTRRARR